MRGEERVRLGAQLGELRLEDRLDQRFARREMPVERSDTDSGVAGDGLQRDLLAVTDERTTRDLEDPLTVARSIRSQGRGDGLRNRRSLRLSGILNKRRILRSPTLSRTEPT